MRYPMYVVPPRGAALRQLCTVVGVCITASLYVTYQLVQSVDTGLYSVRRPTSGHAANVGVDVGGKVFGRSLNMHPASGEVVETAGPTTQSILTRLLKLEERLMEPREKQKVVVIGSPAQETVDLVESTLRKMGRDIPVANNELHWVDGETVVQGNASLVLCVGGGPGGSCSRGADTLAYGQAKVSRIPEMADYLTDPKTLCDVAKLVDRYKGSEPGPCFSPPGDNATSNTEAIKEGSEEGTYVVVSKREGVVPLSEATTEQLAADDAVHWHLPGQPVSFPRGPLLRMNIIITSYLPLKVYMESSLTSATLQSRGEQLSIHVDELLQYMSETYGLGASTQWWGTVHAVVFRHLVYAEVTATRRRKRCRRCFQRLQLTMICSSIRHCFVIKVAEAGLPDETHTLRALLSLTLPGASVAMDVAHALDSTTEAGFKPCTDDAGGPTCLTDDDLVYLLDDRQEALAAAAGDLIKLYPGPDGWRFTPFLGYIGRHGRTEGQTSKTDGQSTVALHQRLMTIQAYYTSLDARQQDLFDISIDTEEVERRLLTYSYESADTVAPQTAPCSRTPAHYSQLLSLHTDPPVPVSQTSSLEYRADVGYNVIAIKIWAFARSCSCHVTFDNKYNAAGPRNQTIGLGDNRISVLVIDSSLSDPKLVATYTLTISRRHRGRDGRPGPGHGLQTCALKQDCSLQYDPSAACGLYPTQGPWTGVPGRRLTACTDGDHTGNWVVPCQSCMNQHSCYWQQASWQPEHCSYIHVNASALHTCVHDKTFLFIGDSTNRGILNYMIQQLNGTIWDWDKTHSMKMYRNINNVNAVFAFAYYPHFWLPTNHRPKFHKVIYQLIKSSLPLANDGSTVLIVGGVHWLAKQHIDIIVTALRRKGLSNITVVVKGLGAGFHLSIEGVRYVPADEQRKLAAREQEVMGYAKSKGFRVAATFNMTMARYKDFVQGKCACHFHKVSRVSGSEKTDTASTYQIGGDINQAYSQIILSQICPLG